MLTTEEKYQLNEALIGLLKNKITSSYETTVCQEAERLIESGADVNYRRDDETMTPLVRATFGEDLLLMRMLLEHGASVNQFCLEGRNPLLQAARDGNESVVELLMEYKANATLMGLNNLNAVDIARLYDHHALASKIELLHLRNTAHRANKEDQSPIEGNQDSGDAGKKPRTRL